MDWNPIRAAVRAAASAATGVPEAEVQLETERGGFAGISRGRRLRLDFDERPVGEPWVEYLDRGDALEPAVVGQLEVGVTFRFSSDDHRDYAWAHSMAHSLIARWRLPQVEALLAETGLVLYREEEIRPIPRVEIDQREQSVASTRLVFGLAYCEAASDAPAAEPAEVDYFDRVELTTEVEPDPVDPAIVIGPEVIGPVA